jgi:hypothetical protein
MTVNSTEYDELVQLKMEARAERHVREHQAAADEVVREIQAAQVDAARAERAVQVHAAEREQREISASARRTRPALVAQYRAKPAGLRLVTTLRDVCLNCGSETVRMRSANTPHILMCAACSTSWVTTRCWSCASGRLDNRDPETAPCKQCNQLKCTDCGGCNPHGCSTNPYSLSFRQRDEAAA